MPTLSIIIPVYNQWRFTKQILDDIPKKIKSDYEVIVIDNWSKDETHENLSKLSDTIVLTHPCNTYVTQAWNTWISIARWEYVMVCNNDITFQEWIDIELIKSYDWKIQSPLIRQTWDLKPKFYATNINWTCWMIKKKDFHTPIPESMRIWYNDDWLFFTYWTNWVTTTEVEHWWSQTVNWLRELNDITWKDKEAFVAISKEKWWWKHY